MPVFNNLQAAVAELKKDPSRPVRAHVDDLDVELRALTPGQRPQDIREFLADLGPWEGETFDELRARLREARQAGGSAEPPRL